MIRTAIRICPLCGKKFTAANSTQRIANYDALQALIQHVDRAHVPKSAQAGK